MSHLKMASRSEPADVPREVIDLTLQEIGESAEQVSAAIGMPTTYLRVYLERQMPRALPARIRRRLAHYLGVPEPSLR